MADIVDRSHIVSRRFAVGLVGGAALVGLASPAFAEREVGHVTAVTGSGFAGATPGRALRPSDSLQMGEKVWTEAASRASLALDLGAVVHMGPEAQLILDRFVTEASGELTLGAGAMVFERDADLPAIDVQVRSTFAQIGLRGTRFFAGPNRGVFAVFVDHGSVSITAGGRDVVLGAGEGIDIPAPGAPPSDVVRWQPPRIAEAFDSVLA